MEPGKKLRQLDARPISEIAHIEDDVPEPVYGISNGAFLDQLEGMLIADF